MKDSDEAPSNMEDKVRNLARRISVICSAFYDRSTQEQKETLWKMLDDLEEAMIAYRKYDLSWDSKLIDVIENIDGIKVKAKAFSTDNSVMDKARELFAFVSCQ